MRLYLIVRERDAFVAVARSLEDIDVDKAKAIAIHAIGLAHEDVPPGVLLCGPIEELSRYRPLGLQVYQRT